MQLSRSSDSNYGMILPPIMQRILIRDCGNFSGLSQVSAEGAFAPVRGLGAGETQE